MTQQQNFFLLLAYFPLWSSLLVDKHKAICKYHKEKNEEKIESSEKNHIMQIPDPKLHIACHYYMDYLKIL